MTDKGKAKRYDEAIEIAKEINNEQRAQPFNVMTKVFPELTESEDERIRKRLMEWVEEFRKLNPTNADHNAECSEALAWLEKQGEQKPWSEEDEEKRKRIMHRLSFDGTINNKDLADINDWLKSLKDRYTWKPSDEQIEALDFAADCIVPAEFCIKRKVLKDLLAQLKKPKKNKVMKAKEPWIPYIITLLIALFVAGLILGYTDFGEYIISKILK